MFSTTNKRSIMNDPRLRGEYKKFLDGQSTYQHNLPGQDHNRGQQALNAVQGTQYHTNAGTPIRSSGQQVQDFVRNRNTEQAGTNRMAPPQKGPVTLPMKRNR